MIENRSNRKIIIINIVMGAIILLIALLFWPKTENPTQSNKIDKSKTQIRIEAKRINLRKEPTIDSEDLGDVFKDEVYTVLDHIDTEEYYWYKIKTNLNVEGYIASSRNDPYVTVISGYIDRTPPIISSERPYLVFLDDNKDYSSVTCTDEYTTCTLTYDDSDRTFITFKGVDEDNNESIKAIKYYNTYSFNQGVYDDKPLINGRFNKEKNGNRYTIDAFYTIKKNIKSDSKSINYSPLIFFYDENFNEVNGIVVKYNEETLPNSCINKGDFSLKDEYLNKDLIKGDILCMSYSFSDQEQIVKYIAIGFTGIENYNDNSNILANYFSNYYLLS